MELCIFTRAYQDFKFDEALEKIKEHELSNLEVISNNKSIHLDLDKALEKEYRKSFEEVMIKNDMSISAISIHRDSQLVLGPHGESTIRFCNGTPDEQIKYGIRRTLQAGLVAKEYGIPVVVGYLGCVDFSQWYPWPYKDGWNRQLKIAKERWMPILEQYDKWVVKFAHEIAPQQIAYNLETAEEIKDILDCKSFGFCYDPSNLVLTGVNPLICIEKLGDKIFHVHAKDAEITHHAPVSGWMSHGDFGRSDRGFRFRIPGWGDLEWKKILTTLKTSGYNGMISIEIEDSTLGIDEGIRKTIQYLKPLLFD